MTRRPPPGGARLQGGAGNRRPNSSCTKDCCSSCDCGTNKRQSPSHRPFTPKPGYHPPDSSDSSAEPSFSSRRMVPPEYYPATPINVDNPRLTPLLESLGRQQRPFHMQHRRLSFSPEVPQAQSSSPGVTRINIQIQPKTRPPPSEYPSQHAEMENRPMGQPFSEYSPPPVYSKKRGSLLDQYEASGFYSVAPGHASFPQYSDYPGFSEDSTLELPDEFPVTSTRINLTSRPCEAASSIHIGPPGDIEPSYSERTLWQPLEAESFATISGTSAQRQPRQVEPSTEWWPAAPVTNRPRKTTRPPVTTCPRNSDQRSRIPGSERLQELLRAPGMDLSQPFLELVRALPWDTVTGVRRIEEVFVTDATGARDASATTADEYSTRATTTCPSAAACPTAATCTYTPASCTFPTAATPSAASAVAVAAPAPCADIASAASDPACIPLPAHSSPTSATLVPEDNVPASPAPPSAPAPASSSSAKRCCACKTQAGTPGTPASPSPALDQSAAVSDFVSTNREAGNVGVQDTYLPTNSIEDSESKAISRSKSSPW